MSKDAIKNAAELYLLPDKVAEKIFLPDEDVCLTELYQGTRKANGLCSIDALSKTANKLHFK